MAHRRQRRLPVWDLPTRLSHWALAAAVTGAWLTGQLGPIDKTWHMRFGYAALLIVGFRVLWGFCGGRHARFASFLPELRRLPGYLSTVWRRAPSPYAGHNPLGALSVLAMLVAIALQAGSGLFADDEILARGPFAASVAHATRAWATALHVRLPVVILALVLLHLLAIAYYAWWKRSDLVRAMVDGHKSVPAGLRDTGSAQDHAPGRLWLALALISLLSLSFWGALTYLPRPMADSFDSW